MAASGSLVGIPLADLQSISAAASQCLVNDTIRGVSYSIAGRSYNFPDLASCTKLLEEANYAIGLLTGARSTAIRANFNPSLGRPFTGGPAIGR